jgi:predicted ABC-type ATPase
LKTLYIVSGANGNGKTTFAMNFAILENIEFINADEIAKQFDPTDIQKYKVKAGKEFFRRLESALDKENSFVIETTLSGKYLFDVIKTAKTKKFQVSLIYLFLETEEENIFRVKNRVLNGGHNVPKEDIIRRYHRSRKLFWQRYKEAVDEWYLFFNGDDNFELIADIYSTYDEELLTIFLEGVENE